MAIALVESQFGPTSTQNLQFVFFLQFFVHFFSDFVLLAGNVVLCQCHSIAHVLALYFLVKADLFDLTNKTRQNGSGTKGIQDKMEPGQSGTRTKRNQDKMDSGQSGSRTIWIQDNMDQGQYGSGTIRKDNRDP